MKCNEHQSKQIFKHSGIPVPEGDLLNKQQLLTYSPPFSPPWMLKAQVLTGGRGKAGGIQKVKNLDDFSATAQNIFSQKINGEAIPFIRVEPAADIAREFYLSVSLQRSQACFVLTIAREGGVDIENMGPDNLLIQKINPGLGLQAHQIRAAFFHLDLNKNTWPGFEKLMQKLFQATQEQGLLLAEINPLVLTATDDWLALDGKVEIDDNFKEINPELEKYYQPEHATRQENEARDAGLSFHSLSGWVGLMVNGAGLAMATMDLLNFSNLPAANFLDLGGGADEKRMSTALKILFSDEQVQVVLVNIFGGILSCENVALAMASALDGKEPDKPMIIRFSGHGAEAGVSILENLKLDNLFLASQLNQALEKLNQYIPEDREPASIQKPTQFKAQKSSRSTHSDPHTKTAKDLQLIDKQTPVLVQGITGKEGKLHSRLMQEYGTNIVAGVTPFKGGQTFLEIPVYNSVHQACQKHEIEASIIFVPASFASDAVLEAVQAEIPLVICITEGVPQQEMLRILPVLQKSSSMLIGPNTPGIIAPGKSKVGIMPGNTFLQGRVAVLSRSGTLTYESVSRLSHAGIGQSLCVGIGGDPFVGTSFVQLCEHLRTDQNTEAILILGEIGGNAEEELAAYVRETAFPKPIISFIAGQTAPPGKRLGHAGAILEGKGGTRDKLQAMQEAGFLICPDLQSIPDAVASVLS